MMINPEQHFKIIHLISQWVASKVTVDDLEELSIDTLETLDDYLQEGEEWAEHLSELDVDKPHHLPHKLLSLTREVLERKRNKRTDRAQTVDEFLTKYDFDSWDEWDVPARMAQAVVLQSDQSEVVVSDDDSGCKVIREPLSNGMSLYVVTDKRSSQPIKEADLLFPEKWRKHQDKFISALANRYWQTRNVVKVTNHEEKLGPNFLEKDVSHVREYRGAMSDIYNRIENFIERGISRSILFQGKPGTGKSTLCLDIARRYSDRTLLVPQDVVTKLDDLFQMEPDLIILDDIEKSSRSLQTELQSMEERHRQVPLLLMTSNNYHVLNSALKRPGRVDQIVEMNTPPDQVHEDILQSFADDYDLGEIPDHCMGLLKEILQEFSPAHALELIKRVAASPEGWDYQVPPHDLTFRETSKEWVEAWNGCEMSNWSEEDVSSADQGENYPTSTSASTGLDKIKKH